MDCSGEKWDERQVTKTEYPWQEVALFGVMSCLNLTALAAPITSFDKNPFTFIAATSGAQPSKIYTHIAATSGAQNLLKFWGWRSCASNGPMAHGPLAHGQWSEVRPRGPIMVSASGRLPTKS